MTAALRRLLDRPLVRFGLVGALNTADYAVVFVLLHQVMGYLPAHVLAYAASLCGSYLLNCRYTFRVRPRWSSFVRFPLTNATSFLVSTTALALLVSQWGLPVAPSLVVAYALPIPVAFLLSRRILRPAAPAVAGPEVIRPG